MLILVRDISVIVDCIIISFHYLVLVGLVNVEFLPRFNATLSLLFPLLVLVLLSSRKVVFLCCSYDFDSCIWQPIHLEHVSVVCFHCELKNDAPCCRAVVLPRRREDSTVPGDDISMPLFVGAGGGRFDSRDG